VLCVTEKGVRVHVLAVGFGLAHSTSQHEFFYSLLNTMEAIQLTNYGGKEHFDMRWMR
jgi:hypothetical protein